jgi:tRNA1Val (adenine37-N6)-methyltransferase
MKVCTDSCLLGAWVADKIEKKVLQPKNILDIGSGTGLLSLMLAQKSKAPIDAVEINESSFLQTKENFDESKWGKHLQVYHTDIKNWSSPVKYDLIISNPPFFENDMKSENPNKNLAKHHDGLTLNELLQSVNNHLTEEGKLALLLPWHRLGSFKKIAGDNHFYLQEECLVKPTPVHSFFRGLLLFSTQKGNSISKELIIKEKEGNYTKDFEELLKDYYL